jgi:hypothetical protein
LAPEILIKYLCAEEFSIKTLNGFRFRKFWGSWAVTEKGVDELVRNFKEVSK